MTNASNAGNTRSTRPDRSDASVPDDRVGSEHSGADMPAQAGTDSASEAARVMKQTSKTTTPTGDVK